MLFEEVSIRKHGHVAVLELFEVLAERGDFQNKRIILVDPEYPDERHRNVYEDIDQETPDAARMVLVTMFPEYAMAVANGSEGGMVVINHDEAIKDIRKMLKLGYIMTSIAREREENE